MSAKTAVKALLLVFVAASLTSVLLREVRKSDSQAAATLPEVELPQDRQITVSYFYTTVRCPTCRKIEAFSKEAVESRFAREILDGLVVFRAVDVESPENQHFTKRYELFTKSLVVSESEGGKELRWKNLEKVWELTGDPKAFHDYVESEVREYLRRQ